MKRVFALLLCLCLIVSVFAACTPEAGNGGDVTTGGNDGGEKHVHTYETTWSKDAEGHWYEATCECEDLEITKTAHTDKDQDKACDVCGYTEHTHTYTEDWQTDAQNHWHAPDCGCPIDNIDTAAHVDANKDGKCDVCAYVIEEHVHQFATEWSSDEAYHWHATTCGHDEAINDKAPHSKNDAGYCTVCNKQLEVIDPSNIKAILGAAIALDSKVTGGVVLFNEMPEGNFGRRNEVVYTLGNGQAYIIYSSLDENDNHLQDLQQWAERLSDDNIFAVQRDGADGEFTVVAGSPHLLTGYNYMPGNLLSAGYDDVNTLALFVYNMYDQMSNGTNVMNAVENYDAENGIYTFSYEWFFVDKQTSGGEVFNISVEYFVVDVEFTIDETGVINAADVTVTTYRNWEMDCDLDYDEATNTVTLRDTATPTTYDYTVTQTSGERTFENPYSKDVMIPSDFELYYVTGTDFNEDGLQYIVSEELIEGTLTLEKDEYVRLHLGNLIPSTALPDFMDTSDFEFTFTNKTEGATGILWKDQEFLRPSYNPLTLNSITFKVADPGEYTMTIRFGQVTKTIEIVVPGETVSELPESDASNVYVETTDTYVWDVDSFTYTAGEEGTYTFNLPAGLGIMKNGADAPAVDFYDNANGATASFDLAAGESVVLYVSAITKDVWHITVDFVAGDVGGGDTPGGDDDDDQTGGAIADDISGTYTFGDSVLVINNDGTMTLTSGGRTFNYTYEINGDTVTYTYNGNASYVGGEGMSMYFGYLTFNAEGMPATFWYNGTENALSTGGDTPGGDEPGGDEPVVNTLVIGENTITVTDADLEAQHIDIEFVVTEAGTYSFASNLLMVRIYDATGMLFGTGSASLEAGTYTVSIITAYVSEAGDYTLTLEYTANEASDEGTEENPIVLESLPTDVTINSDTNNQVYYTYTPSVDGVITVTYPTADSWVAMTCVDDEDYYEGSMEELSHEFIVRAGQTYRIALGTWSVAGEVTISLTFSEGVEANGSADAPFELDQLGDNTCAFPGGYDMIWYTYNVTESGYVTVSTTLATGWLAVGTTPDVYAGVNNTDTIGQPVTLYALAGTTLYIGVADYNEQAADIPFSVAFEAFTSDPIDPIVGDWEGTGDAGWATYTYALTVNADGTGTLTFNDGWSDTVYTVTFILVDGDSVTISFVDEWGNTGSMAFTLADNTLTSNAGIYTEPVTLTPATGGGDDPETPATADGSFANPYELQENNTCDFPGGWNYIFYKYTATTAGTLTITVSGSDFDWGYGASEYALINVAQVATADITLAAGETVYIGMSTKSADAGIIEFTATFGEGGSQQPTEQPAHDLVIGNNNIEGADINFAYTATEDGVLTLELGNAIMGPVEAAILVNSGAAQMLYTGSTVTLNLTTGDVVTVEVTAEGYATIIASWAAAGGSDTPAGPAGSGTSNDPWVIETLPAELTHSGNHDVYYTFTATEDCTIVITYTAGAYVSGLPSNFEKDSAARTWTGTVTAGQVLSINPWASSDATYTIAVATPVTPEQPGEGEGDDATGTTYMTTHGSGRKMKVVVYENGTLEITRSDYSGYFSAGASTSTYTWAMVDGVFTVSGTGAATGIEFTNDGVPVKLYWNGIEYNNFELQA